MLMFKTMNFCIKTIPQTSSEFVLKVFAKEQVEDIWNNLDICASSFHLHSCLFGFAPQYQSNNACVLPEVVFLFSWRSV